jgi:hypothetical protein
MTGIRCRDDIVQLYVIPFIKAQANNVTLQQDNSRPHVARVVHDYLTQQNVDVLPWQADSSDLYPEKITDLPQVADKLHQIMLYQVQLNE